MYGSLLYFVRTCVPCRRKEVHVRYLISWWVSCKHFKGADFQTLLHGGEWIPNCTKFGENRAPSSMHQTLYFGIYIGLCWFVSKWGQLKNEWCRRSRQISHFWPTVKISGVVRENAEQDDRVNTTTEPMVYIWRADTGRSKRLEARWKTSSAAFSKAAFRHTTSRGLMTLRPNNRPQEGHYVRYSYG